MLFLLACVCVSQMTSGCQALKNIGWFLHNMEDPLLRKEFCELIDFARSSAWLCDSKISGKRL